MSKQSQNTYFKVWYENFIKLFRSEFSKLSSEEKKHISNRYNYNSPCQIEVFWLKQPELQLIVETHFKDRPDSQITINGPYDPRVFQDKVKTILNQPRWNVPMNENQSEFPKYYSECLAGILHGLIEIAKNALFSDWEESNCMTLSFTSKTETFTYFQGNMSDCDYRVLIQQIINKTKQRLEDSKICPVPKEFPPKIKYPKGFATYIFPPMVIDKNSKRTVDEILDGIEFTHIFPIDKKILDIIIDGVSVVLEKDGFLGVCIDNKTKSLKILNTLMMVFSLNGMESNIVKEHELSGIEYNPETHDILNRNYHYGPLRNQLFDGIPDKISGHKTKYVDKENIVKIFEKTSIIFADKNLSEDLLLLLEAKTHMNNSEFFQAFFMGWKIIEKYLVQEWYKKHNDSNKKKPPIANAIIIDLKDELQEYFYDFKELRKIRNSSIHGIPKVTAQEAQKCVDVSKELILKNLNLIL